MECNKDEALRAKEIAEKKFLANDISGATKFAMKAQNLFPSLENINQMLTTLNVHLSSLTDFNGEKDWYAILGTDRTADEETIRKRYRKLALQLHPDKNKSVGAEGAFQFISQAWSVLSDKNRRMIYDHKRFGGGFHQKFPTGGAAAASTATATANATAAMKNNFTDTFNGSRFNAAPKGQPKKTKPAPTKSSAATFWTSCSTCKVQYEYSRIYVNLNLMCPGCKKPFLATEIVVPSKTKIPFPGPKSEVHSGLLPKTAGAASAAAASSTAAACLFSKTAGATNNAAASSTAVSGLFSKTAGVASMAAASSTAASGLFPKTADAASAAAASSTTAATGAAAAAASSAADQAANLVQQTYEKAKRENEETQAAAKREEAIRKNNNSSSKIEKQAKRRKGNSGGSLLNFGAGDAMNLDKLKSFSRQFKVRRGYPQSHVHATLVRKSRNELHGSLEALIAARAAKAAEKGNLRMNKKMKEQSNDKSTMKATSVGPSTTSKQTPLNVKISDSKNEDVEPMTIDVPDPDFHDFDKDRSEQSISNDDIWATYDEEDGMPRYYAFIQKVISCKPFKVRMSFLASKSTAEFGSLNWIGSGFAKICGEFRIVRYEVIDTINIFSHKVNYEKGLRGVIKIVPKKGQIWALYRNWSADWNENTPDDVIHKYDMVEILEDYNEEAGLSVAPLIKVAGFKTVFHRHLDSNKVKKIPREEMYRLSHQVPSYVLTGGEGNNAPEGCYELDPAATPLELLQVYTESKTDEVMHASELLKPEQRDH